MKPSNYFALTITLMGATSFTTMVQAEPSLLHYNSATSSYEDAYVSGNFNAGNGNQEQTNYNLDIALDYEKVMSSPNKNAKFDFSGRGSRSRGGNTDDATHSSYQLLGSATIDNYFQP